MKIIFPENSRLRTILTLVLAPIASELIGRFAHYAANRIEDRLFMTYQKHFNTRKNDERPEFIVIDSTHQAVQGMASLAKWTEAYNQIGMTIPSMADYYCAAKSCSVNSIEMLRADLETSLLHTSTMHQYQPDSLESMITDRYGLKNPGETRGPTIVPEYLATSLTDVVATTDGLDYMRAICGTKDDSGTITKYLSRLSGVMPENILLTTPPVSSFGVSTTRKDNPNRSISLSYTTLNDQKYLFILADIENEPGTTHILTVRR